MKRPTTVASGIEVRDLTFMYPGGERAAVDGVTFSVNPGEVLGLLGPSGAGKSTTQALMTGRLRGHKGSVQVLGVDPSSWGPEHYARIGVSFEQPASFPKLSGRENLAFFGSLYDRELRAVDELLGAVGLADDGDRRVDAYSKGMRTRLDFVRALLHGPDILFLDEPTSGLDPVSAARVRGLIRGERERGAAIVLSTHDMVTADEIADRVALIVDGRLAALDEPGNLKLAAGPRSVRVVYTSDTTRESREFDLDGIGHDEGFLDLLRSGVVETIHTTEPTLADVFIALTGRQLT
jgi:fluoroquinolone transport system ATP-binding protein